MNEKNSYFDQKICRIVFGLFIKLGTRFAFLKWRDGIPIAKKIHPQGKCACAIGVHCFDGLCSLASGG